MEQRLHHNVGKVKLSRRRKSRRIKPTAFAFLFLVILGLVWSVSPLQQISQKIQENYRLKQKLSQVKKENQRLKEEVERLNTDQYVELMARKDLGLVKPGEKAYVVITEKKKEKVSSKKDEKKEETFFSRAKAFFKNIFR